MAHLELCIRAFQRKHGYYPPSSFSNTDGDVKVKNNGVNEGIECLLVHIHKQSLGGFATLKDKMHWMGNTDNDDGGLRIEVLGTTKLFEVLDAWEQPLAYFNAGSYDRKQTVAMGGEDQVYETAAPMKNPATGKYLRPRTWQMNSAGEDGVFGTEDDIPRPR